MMVISGLGFPLIWLILLVLFLIIEIVTLGLTTIWFAGGALVAFLAAMIHLPWPVQILLFFGVSLALLFLTRPVAVKYFNKNRIKTNVESMIGQYGIVISPIDNLQGIGQVTVNGQEWSAKAKNENRKYAVGEVVIIRDVQGVKLVVEDKQED